MPRKYKAGDILFDSVNGKAYVVCQFQPANSIGGTGFQGKAINVHAAYRVHDFGRPAAGRFITYRYENELDRMIRTTNPRAAQVLFERGKKC